MRNNVLGIQQDIDNFKLYIQDEYPEYISLKQSELIFLAIFFNYLVPNGTPSSSATEQLTSSTPVTGTLTEVENDLVTANSDRHEFHLCNNSTSGIIYLNFGADASANSYLYAIPPQSTFFEKNSGIIQQRISAIASFGAIEYTLVEVLG